MKAVRKRRRGMPEHASATGVLLAAVLCAFGGMGWLALSMPVHAQQAWTHPPTHAALRVLRWLGAIAIAASLLLCLRADHASMAVLVWAMCLSGGALLTAFILAARPHWLRALAPWVRSARIVP